MTKNQPSSSSIPTFVFVSNIIRILVSRCLLAGTTTPQDNGNEMCEMLHALVDPQNSLLRQYVAQEIWAAAAPPEAGQGEKQM